MISTNSAFDLVLADDILPAQKAVDKCMVANVAPMSADFRKKIERMVSLKEELHATMDTKMPKNMPEKAMKEHIRKTHKLIIELLTISTKGLLKARYEKCLDEVIELTLSNQKLVAKALTHHIKGI